MTDTLALHEAAESIEDFGLRSRVRTACHEINRLRSAVEYWEDQVATLREVLSELHRATEGFVGSCPDPHSEEIWLKARQALAKTEAGR